MIRPTPLLALAALAATLAGSASAQQLPPLPRILTFQGTAAYLHGRPTVFTGYGNYGAFYSDYDHEAFLDELRRHGVNFTRQWVCPIPTDWGDRPDQPIVRLPDGRFDFGRLNPVFWNRFHRFLDLAAARAIVVQVTLWDRVSIARAAYFANNPLNTALGGWLPAVRGVGTPHFFADPTLRPREKEFTEAVVREIHRGNHWNVILEVANEPIGGSIQQVESWHRACYGWIRELSPGLPIMVNPVFRGERLVPDPTDPRVDVVSYHGGQWADEADTASKTAALIARVGKPMVADDDSLYRGVLSRDLNARVLSLAVGALAGGAIGFNHRDDEPTAGAAIDRQALGALRAARGVHTGPAPFPPGRVVRRERFGVATEADFEATADGTGHVVYLAERTIRYRRIVAGVPGAEVAVTYADNRQGRFNLPRIGLVGGVPNLVFGVDSAPGNGLFVTVPQGSRWTRPTRFATTEQIEGFDAEGHLGRLEVVACTIAGSARSIRIRQRAGGGFDQVDLFRGPDREPHLTSRGRSLHVASRFRFVRQTDVATPGSATTRVDRDIRADSAGNPVRALGDGGESWVAWVGWTRVDPVTYYPSGVHLRDPQGVVRTIARFEPTNVTSAQIDAALDGQGVLHLVYDVDGVVRRTLVSRTGILEDAAVAYGQYPRIAFPAPRRPTILFAGGLPGSVTLTR